jgi:HlyD family secretion protein
MRLCPAHPGNPRCYTEGGSHSFEEGTYSLVGKDGQPNPVAVRVGVSDNTSTALLEGPLQEGQQVITGIAHSQNPAGSFGIRLGF